MTDADYADYRQRSIPEHAAELTRARRVPTEQALRMTRENFPAGLADLLARERTWLFRVVSDDQPVGWLWLGPQPHDPDCVMVYDVHIDEAFRGRGLGRATMLAAEDVVRTEGFGRIALNVFGGNDRAERLYRSLGYGVDSTQLSKSLEDPR